MKPYYDEDGITIYQGDSREILPTLSKMDAVITDPPYGVMYAGSATKHSSRNGVSYTAFIDSPEFVRGTVVPVIRAAIERFGRVVVTPGIANARLYPTPDGEGVIWYPSGANRGPWGFITHQPIFYYGKCPYLAAGLGSRPTGFASTEAAEQNGHPCPKPIGQMSWLVKRGSVQGDTVLDPFMGSGTTLVAAKNLGRKAIGIELEERYCEIAAKRLAQRVMEFPA